MYAVVGCEDPVNEHTELSGEQALSAIGRYVSQTGTYVDNQAPYIEACYGSSEIAQAAIRACCVHGGVAALDRHLDALLLCGSTVSGVRMRDGHVVSCSQVVVTRSLLASASEAPVPCDTASAVPCEGERAARTEARCLDDSASSAAQERGPLDPAAERDSAAHADSADLHNGATAAAPTLHRQQPGPREAEQSLERGDTVARGIVMLNGSLLDDGVANACITIPPGACGNAHTVNVWQCHSSLRVCPEQHSLLYLSARMGEGSATAAQILKPCVAALLRAASAASGYKPPEAPSERAGEQRPDRADAGAGADGQHPTLGGASPSAASEHTERCSARAAPASEQQQHQKQEQDDEAVPAGPPGLEICVECYYAQQACAPCGESVPAGLHTARPPTPATTLDGAVNEAQKIFARLCPGLDFLGTPAQQGTGDDAQPQEAEHVEDEAAGGAEEEDVLEAALLALGVDND